MNFHSLLTYVLHKDLWPSLAGFRPELALCATVIVLLLVRMIFASWKQGAFYVALVGMAGALWLALNVIPQTCAFPATATLPAVAAHAEFAKPAEAFTGLLVYDSFSVTLRILLLVFGLLFIGYTRATGVPDPDEGTDFYVLTIGAMIGMCLMLTANHAFMVLLGIEMASVPCYVLAGVHRQERGSTEAALKYAVFGAAAAGVMMYGISLLCGTLGSAHLPTMAARLAGWLKEGSEVATPGTFWVLVLGALMLMVGLAFKLSAVPFHFWAPDVFEGAPAEVGTFLSIASKAAAMGLLARLAIVFAGGSDVAHHADLEQVRFFLASVIGTMAAVTCTFGNLAAYGQTNMKRLLAYSTIAHAGYMMMPVAAAVTLTGHNAAGAQAAVGAVVAYLGVYLFMNFGAFAVVAFLRNAMHSESIADYAGLVRRSPGIAVAMSVILFSLIGMPPLAGFTAKFQVFSSLYDARLIALLAIGGLNTVLSLFYYLRIVRLMIIAAEPENRPAPTIVLGSVPGVVSAAFAAVLLVIFLMWGKFWYVSLLAAAGLV